MGVPAPGATDDLVMLAVLSAGFLNTALVATLVWLAFNPGPKVPAGFDPAALWFTALPLINLAALLVRRGSNPVAVRLVGAIRLLNRCLVVVGVLVMFGAALNSRLSVGAKTLTILIALIPAATARALRPRRD